MSDHDLIDRLAGITPGSALANARAIREDATRHTQGSHDALFEYPDEQHVALNLRLELARLTARLNADAPLEQHYAERQRQVAVLEQSPYHDAALLYARRLATEPVTSNAEHLQALQAAGWSATGIVVLSQIIAFVSYQSRLLTGLNLLLGKGQKNARLVSAGDWQRQPHTRSGQRAPTAFTQQELKWESWIEPLAIDALDERTQLALDGWKLTASPYFRLLARDLDILRERRMADLGIFFTQGGLPRAERELAAATTSKVNGCIYCASGHGRRAGQLSKRVEDVQRLLDTQTGASLSVGQQESWAAQIDFAASLAATPSQAGGEQIERLRAEGLDDLQLLDLVQAVAFFSWANRLMLSLGEPYWPDPQ